MRFSYLTGALIAVAAALCSPETAAQTVINLHFTQNPLFEVSTNSVAAALPGDGTPLTLGGDLTIAGGSGTYTYLWTDTDGTPLGEDSTLTITEPGDYLLTVSDQCDCAQTVTFSVQQAGIDAATIDGIRIFLSGTTLVIEGAEASQASAFTPAGMMVALFTPTQSVTEFNLESLSPGVYLIQLLTTDNTLLIHKIQL